MLLHIPAVLAAAEIAEARRALAGADWVDGRATAGHQSARVKDNLQVPEGHPVSVRLGDMILAALERCPEFIAAALPLRVLPPCFNRYEGGQFYGNHIDGAIRQLPGSLLRVRTDLSATLFLAAPEEYEGGELMIEDSYGAHEVKLPAGDLVLYPATSLHHVRPVTAGARLAAFFWIQSMVRDDARRSLLHELDGAIRATGAALAGDPVVTRLSGVYHNLLRQWAET